MNPYGRPQKGKLAKLSHLFLIVVVIAFVLVLAAGIIIASGGGEIFGNLIGSDDGLLQLSPKR